MNKTILIEIIGAPIWCSDGVKETWREVADWARGQLVARFGDAVQVRYYNLFDIDCPPIPADAQLPFIFVNKEIFSSGGKISLPKLRQHVDELLF